MIRLALRVPRGHAEVVLAELLELAPAGVEEVQLEDAVEYAVYGAPGELPALPDLHAAAGGVPVEVHTSELPDDWPERWKQFHRPVLVESPSARASAGERSEASGAYAEGPPRARTRARAAPLFVRPPWSPPCSVDGAHDIVIDPAQAFGTGSHLTTRLCLELLLDVAALDDPGARGQGAGVVRGEGPHDATPPAAHRGPLLDVGAGSGVLAIAAAKLGYAPVLALDYDPLSIAAIDDNASANGVRIESRRFDLRQEPLPGGYPIVLANLLRPLLLSLADSMAITPPPASTGDASRSRSRAITPRHLIASGLLREEADEIARRFAERLNLRERERRERGEWAALWLTCS